MDELIKRLRNRRICIQQSGSLDDFPLLQEAADAIEELSKPRWISVEERLPEEPGMYIVFLRCGAELQDPGFPDDLSYVTAMHFDFDQRIWNDGIESYNANLDVVNKPHAYYVTHWQPLPEPPKEEA